MTFVTALPILLINKGAVTAYSSDAYMAQVIDCYIPLYTDSPTPLGATIGQSL